MFDEPNQSLPADRQAQPNQPAEDIFASSDPVAPTPTPTSLGGTPPPGGSSPLPEIVEAEPGNKKLVLIAIIVVVVVVLLIAVLSGFWLIRRGNTVQTETPADTTPITETEQLITPAPALIPEPVEPIDTDGDGLSDQEEVALGTSPVVADSDGDGLSDQEEVQTWFTDPLNADTDGDGFNDGAEVEGGFDPNKGGGAKLLEDLGNNLSDGLFPTS